MEANLELKLVEVFPRLIKGQYWKTYGGKNLVKIVGGSYPESVIAAVLMCSSPIKLNYPNMILTHTSDIQPNTPINPYGINIIDGEPHPWALTEIETDNAKILAAVLGKDLK